MYRSLFAAILLAGPALASFGQEMTFKETEYDFGHIMEIDGDVHHDFTFTNTGTAPLVIKDVITGCGCTAAKWSPKPYAPGEKGVIRLTYSPENRKAETVDIVAEVFTNLPDLHTIAIKANVTLAKHSYVNHFDPSKGERRQPAVKAPADDFEVVLERIRTQIFEADSVEKLEKGATSLMKLETAEGEWPNIDYNCRFRTNWEPADHLNRIRRMAAAYTHPESALYGNQVLYRAICQALRAWQRHSPKSFNWWYNDIAAPKTMADILALLAAAPEKVPDGLTAPLIEAMAQSDPRKWTGANKQDIAMHHITRGCVLKNDSIVSAAVEEFFQPICITSGEGIREDMSYQQHNTQIYIGGYGTVFVENNIKIAPLLVGTKYQLSDDRTQLFSKFVRDTYLSVFRGKYIDFSVCGRSVTRRNTLDLSKSAPLFTRMTALDPANEKAWTNANRRFSTGNPTLGRTPANHWFYASDYMLHLRPRFDFSVRAVSTRTCRSESGNGENRYGTYLSEGATCIRVTGDEYFNIFPLWRWDRIPGTTTPTGEVENRSEWGKPGVSEFVAGETDGTCGAMAYDMHDFGVKARKAWFMFNNYVVCLGAGITADGATTEVHTTLNQCFLRGVPAIMEQGADAASARRLQGAESLTDFSGTIYHNKIGYYFPEKTNVEVSAEHRTGAWNRINLSQSSTEEEGDIFQLSVNHGANPAAATYAYVVIPGVSSAASMAAAFDPADVEIICNTPELQAVRSASSGQIQAVFYQPGTLTYGAHTITATEPCVKILPI